MKDFEEMMDGCLVVVGENRAKTGSWVLNDPPMNSAQNEKGGKDPSKICSRACKISFYKFENGNRTQNSTFKLEGEL